MKIELTRNHIAIVDSDVFDELNRFKWHFDGRYAARTVWNKELGKENKVYMHSIVLGERPKDRFIDHINGNKLDNRRDNLRFVTFKQNAQNQSTQKRAKYSRYKGVSFDKSRGWWIAYCKKDGKMNNLGRFNTENEAALAYNEKAKELFGEFAKLNVID